MSSSALLGEAIMSRRRASVMADRRLSRQENPRASSIGDCCREIYHQMVDWDARPLPDIELAERFERGNEIERSITMKLIKDGWEFTEQQSPFEIWEEIPELGGKRTIICTGHVDGRIKWEGNRVPVECKSLHPNVFDRVNSIKDFMQMGTFWARYPRQILLYCYALNEPEGLFIIDDCLGHWKPIPVQMFELADETELALRLARSAKIAKELGTPPPLHPDPTVCAKCWVREAGRCFPALTSSDGVRVVDDFEIEAAMVRMGEIEQFSDEYSSLEKRVKERFKAEGVGSYLSGDFVIVVTAKPRASYDVPDAVKQQYKVPGEAIYVKWERLTPGVESAAATTAA